MITWLSEKLADAMVASGNVPLEDRDIYVYGLDVLLSTAVNVLCVLVIGAVAARMVETLIFLACFIALRNVAGGYHASTHFRCFLIMLAAYAVAMAPTFFFHWDVLRIAAIPAAAVSLAVVAALAPAPHENRPVSPGKLQRFRALSLWIAGGEAAASAACFILNLSSPAYAMAAGMLTAAVSLCVAHVSAGAGRRPSKENTIE